MDLDLTAVESFIAVTDQRHFGRAAESLGVTVSALTKRIQRLERALGVPLIERDSGGFLGLTPAGQRFVQLAPQLIHDVQSARLAATGEAVTTLRLAVPAGVGVVAPLMPAALTTLELALRHAHPGVAVESVPTPFPRLTPDLMAGEVDVVLTFGPSPDPAVASTRLSRIQRVGLVSSTHLMAVRGMVDVREFACYPMLYSPGLPDEYMHPFVLADVRPLSEATPVPIDASNTAHVAQRILQGREVTVVPLALTANLPPELRRVGLRGVPDSWYHAHRRRGDNRPELLTAIQLMADFTESITRSALR
ncbi:LysR family transcriptional regulator [Nocardioides sp. B-3]|uniref:LysR family transcriptional regulator n=1 Tax=Nocardioides sp. B-3 TaxID=2895565 RepID=UPI002152BA8F|nr:LysR family transcriptional regulator [Nocardioides sp. B-3]UUZ58909.1 LysR family transcriptional regulator [Nocardioides sp. B-3]